MYPARVYIQGTLTEVSLKPTLHPLRTLSFKEDYRDKSVESTKCAGVEVVNVVCKVQAHHTKYAQYMHGRDQECL